MKPSAVASKLSRIVESVSGGSPSKGAVCRELRRTLAALEASLTPSQVYSQAVMSYSKYRDLSPEQAAREVLKYCAANNISPALAAQAIEYTLNAHAGHVDL